LTTGHTYHTDCTTAVAPVSLLDGSKRSPRTGLIGEWVLERLEEPLQSALILEWATERSPLSGGHESRTC